MIEPSWVYRLNPAIAIEDFGERSLALHCVDLHLMELNATARALLSKLDGQISLYQAAVLMANDYDRPVEAILADAQAIVGQMVELDIVERVCPAPTES